MDEIDSMKKVANALDTLEADARQRVLDWALAKYGLVDKRALQAPKKDGPLKVEQKADGKELPGIGLINDSGEFQLTVRDPKASNTNDAAIRLALVTVYAYMELTGENGVSSKKVVKPTLEKWRAYTGNTRAILAKHRGLLREGDILSLDVHAKREAQAYINDVLDDAKTGTWQASKPKQARRASKKSGQS